jgi:hypothetical protein
LYNKPNFYNSSFFARSKLFLTFSRLRNATHLSVDFNFMVAPAHDIRFYAFAATFTANSASDSRAKIKVRSSNVIFPRGSHFLTAKANVVLVCNTDSVLCYYRRMRNYITLEISILECSTVSSDYERSTVFFFDLYSSSPDDVESYGSTSGRLQMTG